MVSGVDMVFVDHIQGLRADGITMSQERELLNAVTAGLKTVAGNLNVPIMAISHIRRPGDEMVMSRPSIRSAHGSSSVEKDSDAIFTLCPVRIDGTNDRPVVTEFASRVEFLEQQKTGMVGMEVVVQKSRDGGSPKALFWLDYRRGGQWHYIKGG